MGTENGTFQCPSYIDCFSLRVSENFQSRSLKNDSLFNPVKEIKDSLKVQEDEKDGNAKTVEENPEKGEVQEKKKHIEKEIVEKEKPGKEQIPEKKMDHENK